MNKQWLGKITWGRAYFALLIVIIVSVMNMSNIYGLLGITYPATVYLKGCDSKECAISGELGRVPFLDQLYVIREDGSKVVFGDESFSLIVSPIETE
jgi:hypothetical protein